MNFDTTLVDGYSVWHINDDGQVQQATFSSHLHAYGYAHERMADGYNVAVSFNLVDAFMA